MPIEFDIDSDFVPKVIVDATGCHLVEFRLAVEPERNCAHIMSVMLVPGASYLRRDIRSVYDLKFGIRAMDLDHVWKVGAPDFTLEESRRCIRDADRTVVLAGVLRAIAALIGAVRPRHVTMATFYPALPAKALAKYQKIAAELQRLGYDLADQFGDPNGKSYWYFRQPG